MQGSRVYSQIGDSSSHQSKGQIGISQRSNNDLRIICADHQGYMITHFCSKQACLKGLCQKCIKEHNSYHKERNEYAEIEILEDINTLCQQKLQNTIKNYSDEQDQVSQQIQSEEQHQTSQQVLQKVKEAESQCISIVQSYFTTLRKEYDIAQRKIEAEKQKMGQQLLEIEQEKMKLGGYLNSLIENQFQLTTLQHILRMDDTIFINEKLAVIESYFTQLVQSAPHININFENMHRQVYDICQNACYISYSDQSLKPRSVTQLKNEYSNNLRKVSLNSNNNNNNNNVANELIYNSTRSLSPIRQVNTNPQNILNNNIRGDNNFQNKQQTDKNLVDFQNNLFKNINPHQSSQQSTENIQQSQRQPQIKLNPKQIELLQGTTDNQFNLNNSQQDDRFTPVSKKMKQKIFDTKPSVLSSPRPLMNSYQQSPLIGQQDIHQSGYQNIIKDSNNTPSQSQRNLIQNSINLQSYSNTPNFSISKANNLNPNTLLQSSGININSTSNNLHQKDQINSMNNQIENNYFGNKNQLSNQPHINQTTNGQKPIQSQNLSNNSQFYGNTPSINNNLNYQNLGNNNLQSNLGSSIYNQPITDAQKNLNGQSNLINHSNQGIANHSYNLNHLESLQKNSNLNSNIQSEFNRGDSFNPNGNTTEQYIKSKLQDLGLSPIQEKKQNTETYKSPQNYAQMQQEQFDYKQPLQQSNIPPYQSSRDQDQEDNSNLFQNNLQSQYNQIKNQGSYQQQNIRDQNIQNNQNINSEIKSQSNYSNNQKQQQTSSQRGNNNMQKDFQISWNNYFKSDCKYQYLHFFQPKSNILHIVNIEDLKIQSSGISSENYLKFYPITMKVDDPNFTVPRFHKSITTIDGSIYLIGGISPSSNHSNLVYKYDFSKNKLILVSEMITGRSGFGCVYCPFNNSIYVIGGACDEDGVTKQCERYDLNLNKWFQIPYINTPTFNPTIAYFKSQTKQHYIYKFGGKIDDNELDQTIERYDLQNDIWEVVNINLKQVMLLSSANCCQINETQILIFGGSQPFNQENNCSSCFLINIETDPVSKNQLIHSIKGINQLDLPNPEGFSSQQSFIYDNQLYTVQNVSENNHQDIIYLDRKRIICFNSQSWMVLNQIELLEKK